VFLDEEGGFTSVTVACALMVSIALAFALVETRWILSRSGDIQTVADACAVSGEEAVRSYVDVAHVVDACVVSLGVAGMVTAGAGLVVAAVPGLGSTGAQMVETGVKILDARSQFATSAQEGLQAIEAALPAAIAVNAYQTAVANSDDGVSYTGVALAFPETSQTVFGALDALDTSGLSDAANKLASASDAYEELQDTLNEAKRAGWEADVGGATCLRERAQTLASLSGTQNPYYDLATWNFGAALTRARAYYQARAAQEAPLAAGDIEGGRSGIRKVFYAYALAQMQTGYFYETSSEVTYNFPLLFKNTSELKASTLYSQVVWPVSDNVMHAYSGCSAASAITGTGSLAALDAGVYRGCESCDMKTTTVGQVASASSNISNGFEYYWRAVVTALEKYAATKVDLAQTQEEYQTESSASVSALESLVNGLTVGQTQLCPPGAWGTVALVSHGEVARSEAVKTIFATQGTLPAGVAVAAATLAPNNSTSNTVLTALLDTLVAQETGASDGFIGVIVRFWNSALSAYAASTQSVETLAQQVFDGLDTVGATSISSWLEGEVTSLVSALGLAPATLTVVSPVLCSTEDVLTQAGYNTQETLEAYLAALPTQGSLSDYVVALGKTYLSRHSAGTVTVAELPIPGTGVSIPLTIDLSCWDTS
jgi:hypothetical protein